MINKRSATLSLIITIIILGGMASQLPKLGFDYQFEKFFPIGDPDLIYYEGFTEKFGTDNNYIMIGIEPKNGLFNKEFMTTMDHICNQLDSLPGSQRVITPTQIKKPVKTPLGYVQIPYLHIHNEQALKSDSIKLLKKSFFREAYFSEDWSTIRLIVQHDHFLDKKDSDHFVLSMDKILAPYAFKKVRKVGKAIAQHAFIDAIKSDFTKFLVGVILLVISMLFIFMRSGRLVFVSIIIAGLSVVATLSFMVITGKKIDILSTLIPSILLVVSMSDIVHLFAQVRRELSLNDDYTEAVKKAVKEIGWATFLTSFTTAIGFITLVNIKVVPVIDLGIYSAAGIFIAFLVTYGIFPSIMLLTQPKFPPRRNQKLLSGLLSDTIRIIFKKRKNIFGISAMLFIVVTLGILQLKVDDYLIDDIPDTNLIKADFLFFDKEFGGSKPFTMSIELTDSSKSIYSKEVLTEISHLHDIADSTLNAETLLSPASFIKGAYQSLKGGSPEYYRLPETNKEWKKSLSFIKRFDPESKASKLSDGKQAQIIGYAEDIGSLRSQIKRERFEQIANEHIDSNIITYREVGTSFLMEKSSEILSFSLLKGLLIALGMVCLISGLMFKSIKMVLITLIPNLFPILSVAAIMGYFGIPINFGTSIIFAISFGIVVDDTIHFLSKFKIERDKGRSIPYAIKRTVYGAGEPIIITTIILTAGFIIFCVSEFSASFYTGLFVSISFIVALIADLFLLPALILQFFRENDKK